MAKRLVREESAVMCTPLVNTDLLFNTFIREGQSISEGLRQFADNTKLGG